MYSENYKANKLSFWLVLVCVTVVFCLLSLPEWLGWEQYSGFYEIIVLIAAAVLMFNFIRRRFYEYTYIINEDIITVCLKVGSKDSVICQIPVNNIIDVFENKDLDSVKKEYGVENIVRCNGDMLGNKGTNIVYIDPEKTVKSLLIFMPSEKFTEILQTKRIDNHVKI